MLKSNSIAKSGVNRCASDWTNQPQARQLIQQACCATCHMPIATKAVTLVRPNLDTGRILVHANKCEQGQEIFLDADAGDIIQAAGRQQAPQALRIMNLAQRLRSKVSEMRQGKISKALCSWHCFKTGQKFGNAHTHVRVLEDNGVLRIIIDNAKTRAECLDAGMKEIDIRSQGIPRSLVDLIKADVPRTQRGKQHGGKKGDGKRRVSRMFGFAGRS